MKIAQFHVGKVVASDSTVLRHFATQIMDAKPKDSNLPAVAAASNGSEQAVIVYNKTKSMSWNLKQYQQRSLANLHEILPPDKRDSFVQNFLRWFDPWPDWVLRIAAEVIHVRVPTIPKETIEDTLRFFHFIVFVATPEGVDPEPSPKFPDLKPQIAGAIVGHCAAYSLHLSKRIEEARKFVPADKLEEISKQVSPEHMQNTLAPLIANYLKRQPEAFLGFQQGYAQAEAGTFDQKGLPKETPLTQIYEKILADWTEIECLSGPKELCVYLSPMLGNQHFDLQYERVKKICQRMQITFKPLVKGQ